MSDFDSVPWEQDPVRKAILNEPGKTIHDLREKVQELELERDRAIENFEVLAERVQELEAQLAEYSRTVRELAAESEHAQDRVQELVKQDQEQRSLIRRLNDDAAVDALIGKARREYREALDILAEQEHA